MTRSRVVWFIVGALIGGGGAIAAWEWATGPDPITADVVEVREQLEQAGFEELEAVDQEELREQAPDVPEGARVSVVIEGGVDFREEGPPEWLASDFCASDEVEEEEAPPSVKPRLFYNQCFAALRLGDLAGDCHLDIGKDPTGKPYARLKWRGKAQQWERLADQPTITETAWITVEDLGTGMFDKRERESPRWFEVSVGLAIPDVNLRSGFGLHTKRVRLRAELLTETVSAFMPSTESYFSRREFGYEVDTTVWLKPRHGVVVGVEQHAGLDRQWVARYVYRRGRLPWSATRR